MSCKEAIGKLYEYLDNEFDDSSYSMVKSHLGMCSACSEKFEFEQSLKKIVKVKTQTYKAPQNMLESIIKQLSEINVALNRTEHATLKLERRNRKGIFQLFSLRPAYIMAAALIPLVISALSVYLVFFKPIDHSPIIEGVAQRHENLISNEAFLGLIKSDAKKAKRYFKDSQLVNFATDAQVYRIPTQPVTAQPIPNQTVHSYPRRQSLFDERLYFGGQRGSLQNNTGKNEIKLLGSKDFNLAGRKSVYVGLERKTDKVSLEIVDSSGINIDGLEKELLDGQSYYFGKHKGYNVVLWKNGDTLCSLTSEMNLKELIRIAEQTICSYHE